MKERLKNYDYLRSFACIAVVLLHVSSSYWDSVGVDTADFTIMTIYNGLTRFAVPVFMMLSGGFLLNPQKEMRHKSIVKRIFKLLVVLYFWSAFYAFQGLAVKFVIRQAITQELVKTSFERFLWGHYHMWFLFLMLGFYILLPVVRKLCESKSIMEYYLILWLATAYIIPNIVVHIGLDWVNMWIYKLSMNMLIGYIGYFMLGYYIKTYGVNIKIRALLYIGGIIGYVYTVLGTIVLSGNKGGSTEELLNPGAWNVLIMAIAVYTFFTYKKEWKRCYGLVRKLAKYSLTIYMVHPFFIEKLNLIGITTCSFQPVFSIPVLTIMVFGASFFVAFMIDKLCPKLLL